MGWLHWLILVPYYFFTAISLFLAALTTARLLRLDVRANTLAVIAVAGGLVAVASPLLLGLAGIDDYRAGPMFGLAGLSLVLAVVDALLQSALPVAADRELQQT